METLTHEKYDKSECLFFSLNLLVDCEGLLAEFALPRRDH